MIVYKIFNNTSLASNPSLSSLKTLAHNSQTSSKLGRDEIDFELFKNGDIIFRKDNRLESQMVLMFDDETLFNHVGLVQKIDNTVYVIHVGPGNPEEGKVVRREKLTSFLKKNVVEHYSIYRLREEYLEYSPVAVINAIAFWEEKRVFDPKFSLKTQDKLYCTELVWLAYLQAGLDLTDGKRDYMKFTFGKKKYIFPSLLHNSPYVRQVSF